MSISKITNAWICQITKQSVQPLFGDLHLEKGKISQVRLKPFQDFVNQTHKQDHQDETIIDVNGRVITVPLINFHDHLYSRLAKGLAVQGPMDNFPHILENLWWKLDPILDTGMIEACAQMGLLESIRLGVTYIFDHHASPGATKQSLDTLSEVFQRYGLRGVFCFETSDRNGISLAQQGLEENKRFFEERTDSDLKAMLGLHASFTLSDETLKKAAEMVRDFHLGIHIHLCEDKVDIEKSLELFQKNPVERLTKYNLLNAKSILSHGIHLTKDDYAAISQSGSAIVYNPDSNLNNSVGLPEFHRVPESIPILIGTDGMHANIARHMKQLFLLYRHQGNDMDSAFSWIKKIYFNQLEFIDRYFPDFPSLQADDRADLIVWDYIPPTPFSEENFWGHYLYGMLERPIHTVIQEGELLMKDHRLQIPGENEVLLSIYKQGERLFERFN
jgi:cytosine/adenosine deaminase-related metal-dependent hydrolase